MKSIAREIRATLRKHRKAIPAELADLTERAALFAETMNRPSYRQSIGLQALARETFTSFNAQFRAWKEQSPH